MIVDGMTVEYDLEKDELSIARPGYDGTGERLWVTAGRHGSWSSMGDAYKAQCVVLRYWAETSAEDWADCSGFYEDREAMADFAPVLLKACRGPVFLCALLLARVDTLEAKAEETPTCRPDCAHYVHPCAGADGCAELGQPCRYESSKKGGS